MLSFIPNGSSWIVKRTLDATHSHTIAEVTIGPEEPVLVVITPGGLSLQETSQIVNHMESVSYAHAAHAPRVEDEMERARR